MHVKTGQGNHMHQRMRRSIRNVYNTKFWRILQMIGHKIRRIRLEKEITQL